MPSGTPGVPLGYPRGAQMPRCGQMPRFGNPPPRRDKCPDVQMWSDAPVPPFAPYLGNPRATGLSSINKPQMSMGLGCPRGHLGTIDAFSRLKLIVFFNTTGRLGQHQPWSWLGGWRSRARALGGRSHSGGHRSRWRTACSRWSVSIYGLHKCVLILIERALWVWGLRRAPCAVGGLC